MPCTDSVYIIGGTGNIGTKVVQDLLARQIPMTLYVRNPAKAQSLFPNHNGLLTIVQGGYEDLTPLKESVGGHARLFLLVYGIDIFVKLKTDIATIAYGAGIKQIVDISSTSVNMGWRTSSIGTMNYDAEKAIIAVANRGTYVALRAARFMSNLLSYDDPLHRGNMIFDTPEPERRQGFVSTNDIGAVAAVVLSEDIAKHADAVYSLVSDVVTPNQRAEVLTKILGTDIKYQQIPPRQKYQALMSIGMSHVTSVDLVGGLQDYDDARVTPEIEILLARSPETVEQYLTANKQTYLK